MYLACRHPRHAVMRVRQNQARMQAAQCGCRPRGQAEPAPTPKKRGMKKVLSISPTPACLVPAPHAALCCAVAARQHLPLRERPAQDRRLGYRQGADQHELRKNTDWNALLHGARGAVRSFGRSPGGIRALPQAGRHRVLTHRGVVPKPQQAWQLLASVMHAVAVPACTREPPTLQAQAGQGRAVRPSCAGRACMHACMGLSGAGVKPCSCGACCRCCAPQVWSGRAYSYSSDLWSLGAVMYEMCTFRVPMEGRSMQDLRMRIMAGKFTPIPSGRYSQDLVNLCHGLLSTDPKRRCGTGRWDGGSSERTNMHAMRLGQEFMDVSAQQRACLGDRRMHARICMAVWLHAVPWLCACMQAHAAIHPQLPRRRQVDARAAAHRPGTAAPTRVHRQR